MSKPPLSLDIVPMREFGNDFLRTLRNDGVFKNALADRRETTPTTRVFSVEVAPDSRDEANLILAMAAPVHDDTGVPLTNDKDRVLQVRHMHIATLPVRDPETDELTHNRYVFHAEGDLVATVGIKLGLNVEQIQDLHVRSRIHHGAPTISMTVPKVGDVTNPKSGHAK